MGNGSCLSDMQRLHCSCYSRWVKIQDFSMSHVCLLWCRPLQLHRVMRLPTPSLMAYGGCHFCHISAFLSFCCLSVQHEYAQAASSSCLLNLLVTTACSLCCNGLLEMRHGFCQLLGPQLPLIPLCEHVLLHVLKVRLQQLSLLCPTCEQFCTLQRLILIMFCRCCYWSFVACASFSTYQAAKAVPPPHWTPTTRRGARRAVQEASPARCTRCCCAAKSE